ncbi:LOW QUALITY PROTEIN: hypothetical protein HID58_088765, partial [Brassica napus]
GIIILLTSFVQWSRIFIGTALNSIQKRSFNSPCISLHLHLIVFQGVIKNFHNVVKTKLQILNINMNAPVSVYRPNFANLRENGVFISIQGDLRDDLMGNDFESLSCVETIFSPLTDWSSSNLIVQGVIKNFNNIILFKTKLQILNIKVIAPMSVNHPNFTNLGENESSTTNKHSLEFPFGDVHGLVELFLKVIKLQTIKVFTMLIPLSLLTNTNNTAQNRRCLNSRFIYFLSGSMYLFCYSRSSNLMRESEHFTFWDCESHVGTINPMLCSSHIHRTKTCRFKATTRSQQQNLVVQFIIKNFHKIISLGLQINGFKVITPVSVYCPNITSLGQDASFPSPEETWLIWRENTSRSVNISRNFLAMKFPQPMGISLSLHGMTPLLDVAFSRLMCNLTTGSCSNA